MVADRNSTHASANGERASRRVCLPDQRSGPRTLLGADSEGNAGGSGLSTRGQSGGGSRSLAQSGGSPRTPERDVAVSILDHPVGLDADFGRGRSYARSRHGSSGMDLSAHGLPVRYQAGTAPETFRGATTSLRTASEGAERAQPVRRRAGVLIKKRVQNSCGSAWARPVQNF